MSFEFDFKVYSAAEREQIKKAASLIAEERRTGLIISGSYGCGKTSLARHMCPNAPLVPLTRRDGVYQLTSGYADLTAQSFVSEPVVILDDLGNERPCNEYGNVSETVGDFILERHEYRQRHYDEAGFVSILIITTNLTVNEINERYGGRVVSRLKDLCIPLRLAGKDLRQWRKL